MKSHDGTLTQGSPPRPAGIQPCRRDLQNLLTGLLRSGARPLRRNQADHWSFVFSQIAVYSFVVACVTGIFLVFFFKPGMTGVIYHGSYHELNGVRMSEAYKSTLDISFDVRGGLLIRQIHHWSALIFVAAVCLQLLRLFFTAASRRPRWLVWLIWVTLLPLGMAAGWSGGILPDDMFSGGSLGLLQGVLESIPLVGGHLTLWGFGGDVPGHRIIPRLYWVHVLLPVAMAALFVLRRRLVRRHGHARFPGAAGAGRLGSLQHGPAAAAMAMFFATCGVLALAGALAQINPIWLSGPAQPGSISTGATPDWYMGFLDGALRIMPGWELNVAGHPLTLAVLVPALIIPGAFFTVLAAYPLLERRLTGDRGEHHFLDRPHSAATRTAVGAAGITLYGLLWAASANDQIAYHIHLDLYAVTWFFRVAVFAGPPLAYTLTQRICLGLTRREREETKHGRETGRVVMSPGGGFSEITEPIRPVREDGPGSNLPGAGQGVTVGGGHPDLDRRAALGPRPAGEVRRAVAPRATARRPQPGPGAVGGTGRLGVDGGAAAPRAQTARPVRADDVRAGAPDLVAHPSVAAEVAAARPGGDGDEPDAHQATAALLTELTGDRPSEIDWSAIAVLLQGATAHYWLLTDPFGRHPTGAGQGRFVTGLVALTVAVLSGTPPSRQVPTETAETARARPETSKET